MHQLRHRIERHWDRIGVRKVVPGANHEIRTVCGEGFDPPDFTSPLRGEVEVGDMKDPDGARTSGQNGDFCLPQGKAR
jgi:hypothetical protein